MTTDNTGAPPSAKQAKERIDSARRSLVRSGVLIGAAAGLGIMAKPSTASALEDPVYNIYDTPFSPGVFVFNANMTQATFDRATMERSIVAESNMKESAFLSVDATASSLENVTLDNALIKNSSLRNVAIENCDIEGLLINGINIAELIAKF